MKNEAIICICLSIVILVVSIFAGIQSARVISLNKSVDRYRYALEYARQSNDRYADTFRRASETNTRIGECLSEHISTLEDLRRQLGTIKSEYEQMREIIDSVEIDRDLDDFDNSAYNSGSDSL